MNVRIVEEPVSMLGEYATVSIAFEVRGVVDIAAAPIAGDPLMLIERAVSPSVIKDYDAASDEGPRSWLTRFALSRWALFAAYRNGVRVGGAAIVRSTTEVELLDGRQDLALLWDLRVAPDMRRCGVGIALLQAAERWAADQGARWLKVETQDLNVPACRFYLRNGFQLRTVHVNAYPSLPHEKQLLWYKRLIETDARVG